MATETLEEKTIPEIESPTKKESDSPKIDEAEKDDVETEEEEEEGSGSKEKEVVTPTNDRPTRERKKVERFSLSDPVRTPQSKSVSIEKGRGTTLKEIPNVVYNLSKRKADDNMMLLHTFLYGKKAKTQMVKRNIGQFSGYVWPEKEEEKQRGRMKEKLDKLTKEKIIFFCDVLDIPISRASMRKEELSAKVFEFLESPKATRDVILADREKEAKKRKSTPKRGKSGESSETPAKFRTMQRKRTTKKQDVPSDTKEGKAEEEADSEVPHEEEDAVAAPKEESDHEETETEDEKDVKEEDEKVKVEEDEKPSRTRRSSARKKAADEEKNSVSKTKEKKVVSAKGKEKQVPTKASTKRTAKSTSTPAAKKQKVVKDESTPSPAAKKQKVVKDESSSKEKTKNEPSKPTRTKRTKERDIATVIEEAKATEEEKAAEGKTKEPTREEMLVVATKILKEVDFNTATLTDISKNISDHFGVDLSHRKPEIKAIITEAINAMSDEDSEEDEEEEEAKAGSDKEEKAEDGSDKEKEEEEEKKD